MCGIAGFVSTQEISRPESTLRRMMDAIRHRGPDDRGIHCDAPAYLGHLRLSIVDLAGGHQPMCNEDGSVWVAYNGEIFNHAALRPPLQAAGHVYTTNCDTETILHAYEQHGPACVAQFRGMFAFALWDGNRRTLFCARDRLGIKPLYYFWDGRVFAFASEIKALLAHPSISASMEDSLLAEYLAFGYISEERTLFRGIRRLMPGHFLELDCRDASPRLRVERYWDAPQPGSLDGGAAHKDERGWIDECRARLEETVRMRLMSDVPLGMFLSGGVDSSAIAALMKRMVAGPVKTFAVGYGEAEFSELSYARQVAGILGTDHHEVVIGRQEFFQSLPGLVWHEDEPIAWPSSVSLYFVARLASEEVKVVLTGEGSDELFGGYSRYQFYDLNARWLRWYRAVPEAARRAVRRGIGESHLLSATLRRKLGHTLLGRGEDLESLYLDNFYCAFSAAGQRDLLRAQGQVYANFLRYWNPAAPTLAAMLYADQKTYLVELLMKQDQMSMACSIESRVPFLDHTFVEFAARVPDKLKIAHGTGKYILKRAVEDLLPREIVYRKKMGFPTPLRQWLTGPAAEQQLANLEDPDGLLAAYLDGAQLRALLDRHRRGVEDATDRIWRLLNLQIWGDIFITGKRAQPWAELPAAALRSS
jgi:asparagine synthase (glutamine-hydrolysing)